MSKFKLRRAIGVPAEVAGSELERIHEEQGRLTPEILVDESRPEDAPLHPAFTWDDKVAAEYYRLGEARNIIRAVHVVGDDGTDHGCAYAHVTVESEDGEEESGAYLSVERVVQDPDLLTSAIRGLARKQEEASRALSDLEREARRLGKRKHANGISRAMKATETAAQELGALT